MQQSRNGRNMFNKYLLFVQIMLHKARKEGCDIYPVLFSLINFQIFPSPNFLQSKKHPSYFLQVFLLLQKSLSAPPYLTAMLPPLLLPPPHPPLFPLLVAFYQNPYICKSLQRQLSVSVSTWTQDNQTLWTDLSVHHKMSLNLCSDWKPTLSSTFLWAFIFIMISKTSPDSGGRRTGGRRPGGRRPRGRRPGGGDWVSPRSCEGGKRQDDHHSDEAELLFILLHFTYLSFFSESAASLMSFLLGGWSQWSKRWSCWGGDRSQGCILWRINSDFSSAGWNWPNSWSSELVTGWSEVTQNYFLLWRAWTLSVCTKDITHI